MGLAVYKWSTRSFSSAYFKGSWENGQKGVTNRYLGLEFKVNGNVHYGWVRLNFPFSKGATITGYAYETIPNKPIITRKT